MTPLHGVPDRQARYFTRLRTRRLLLNIAASRTLTGALLA